MVYSYCRPGTYLIVAESLVGRHGGRGAAMAVFVVLGMGSCACGSESVASGGRRNLDGSCEIKGREVVRGE